MRSKVEITLTKYIEEEDRKAVRELHQSDELMSRVKQEYIGMLSEMFNMRRSDIGVKISVEDME